MKTDRTAIYIDLKALHELIYKAQFTMTKGDRIVMGNRLLDLSQDCVTLLSNAVNTPDDKERLSHLDRLAARFDALRLNLQCAESLGMIKDTRSTVDRAGGGRQKISPLILGIFQRVAKIDEGIGKWRTATKARSAARELPAVSQ